MDTAICVTHHAVKAGRDDPFDAFLGSTSIFGTVETGIILARNPESNVRTIRSRSRHGRDLDETVITLDESTGSVILGNTTDELRSAAKQDKTQSLESETIAFVSAHPACTEDEIRAAVTSRAVDRRNVLSKLVATAVLDKTGMGVRGDPYRYTLKPIPVETADERIEL